MQGYCCQSRLAAGPLGASRISLRAPTLRPVLGLSVVLQIKTSMIDAFLFISSFLELGKSMEIFD
jgi:hypothetical protein